MSENKKTIERFWENIEILTEIKILFKNYEKKIFSIKKNSKKLHSDLKKNLSLRKKNLIRGLKKKIFCLHIKKLSLRHNKKKMANFFRKEKKFI